MKNVTSSNKIKCPRCEKIQKQIPEKTWSYGKMIKKRDKTGTIWGHGITCNRFLCSKCKKFFNFYISSGNKTWTIPKFKK